MNAKQEDLLALLSRFAGRNVWVYGDIMLDEYVQGDVERISPEAPVPVVRVGTVEFRTGGASNVARQVAALGANALLAGPIGDDQAATRLLDLCDTSGISTRGVTPVPDRRTTRKLRVLGHGQQLLRLDWDQAEAYPEAHCLEAVERLRTDPRPDIIILSDYAKGAITPASVGVAAKVASDCGCPLIADPKSRDFSLYRGVDVLTPNLRELAIAAGRELDDNDTDAVAAVARSLLHPDGPRAMVVTLAERGALVVTAEDEPLHLPAVRRAVRDVTGAGDTFIAFLASGLAAGVGLAESAAIANLAAGLAVSEVGAVAVAPSDIRRLLGSLPGNKLLDRDSLAARADNWRSAGRRIVFTNGCFDILHAGHVALLQKAASLGDVLIVGLNSDASIRRLKGRDRPIVAQHDRASMISALECVDAVTLFEDDTPLGIVEAVRPDVLVKGEDYAGSTVVGRELVESGGGRVVLLPLLPGRSSTSLVERIRSGMVDDRDLRRDAGIDSPTCQH